MMIGRSLINYRTVRGMASLKDVAVRTLNPSNIQKVTQKMANSKFTKAALVELRPPTPMEIPAAIKDGLAIFKTNWSALTVREAWLNLLVTTEVVCWFFVGECIGKGTLIGYQV